MKEELTRRELIKQGGLTLAALAVPFPLNLFTKYNKMENIRTFDVIIVGGSYAGLSAAMALGRALRNVLIIDSGQPCNRQTPYSHNFITLDGVEPAKIAEIARAQVQKYSTIRFLSGLAVSGKKTSDGFTISTETGEEFTSKKLIFATGIKDIMPDIQGFAECWGITVIHCPYCHGYEVKNEVTGILANGDVAFHYARLIRNWTKDLAIFTNGISTLSAEQMSMITKHKIPVIEKEVSHLQHNDGQLEQIIFKDGSSYKLKAIYSRPNYEQHCKIPEMLGCAVTEQGLLQVDMFQKTTVPDIMACGDNASLMRAVSYATAMGNIAGAMTNNALTEEEF